MNKHQIIAYIKYGKLISEINDKIKDTDIKTDMIKFLIKFPRNLKYPSDIDQPTNEKYGKFMFEIIKPSKILSIYFDGNNNFQIWHYNEWTPSNKSNFFHITRTSLDDIEYNVKLYQNYFNNIIE